MRTKIKRSSVELEELSRISFKVTLKRFDQI
jgi:hypothetical protein